MTQQHWTSYRSLFRFTGIIYRLDSRTKLPGPVKVEKIIIFIFIFVLLCVPCWILEPVFNSLFHVNWWIEDVTFSFGLTLLFTNFDPAGKFLPFYVLDIIKFYCLPKRHRIGSPYKPDGKKKENGKFYILD